MNATDPKGHAGLLKPQLQTIPPIANREMAAALTLGATKYGPWNWRGRKVEVMTYIGAMRRHLDAFLDGEDLDPESHASHLGHVMAGCAIVLDAREHDNLVDNRPPRKRQVETSRTNARKPRKLNGFRALLRIFRLEKALEAARRQTEGAWQNRNHFCREINIIGKEIIGPRIGSFNGDACAPEAVTRETLKLLERYENEIAELRSQLKGDRQS